MAIPVLIIGRSGAGKTTAMRNCIGNSRWNLIKVLSKPLPFPGSIPCCTTDDYKKICASLAGSDAKSIVIDDAGYLLTNKFMKEHSSNGKGSAIFDLYNDIGDSFWNLIMFIMEQLPEDKIVYVIMHEDKNEHGDIAPKTIGRMLDEKVCVEGMFTIVLRAVSEMGKYYFITQCDQGAVSKSPIGMFEDLKIDNDLDYVDKQIRKYYSLEGDIKK